MNRMIGDDPRNVGGSDLQFLEGIWIIIGTLSQRNTQ